MSLLESLEKLGRAIFELPFSALNEAPELAEVRLAVLDAVKARSHRTGSVRVFSFGVVRVELRGIAGAQAPAFQSGFFAEYLARDLQTALARASVRFPEQLRVEVRTTEQLPGPGQDWVLVEVLNDTESKSPAAQAPLRTPRPARLLVVVGKANKTELLLTKTRTNIGRSVDVLQANGPVRRNDLAFVEDTEINRTVSREHSHIISQNKSGHHRIYNDRWYRGKDCGLWILRDGLSQPVHRGDRGLVLMPDDEIYVGRAVIKFVQPSGRPEHGTSRE